VIRKGPATEQGDATVPKSRKARCAEVIPKTRSPQKATVLMQDGFFYAPDACKNSGKEMHASMITTGKSKHHLPPLTEISSTYLGAHRYLPGFIGLKGGNRNV
jgi:hypothetical protein